MGELQTMTAKTALNGAVILLGEPKDESAAVARATLKAAGAAEIAWRRDIRGMRASLDEAAWDLAIFDIDMPGGDAIDLAASLRRGDVGAAPFMPLILTTRQAERAPIERAMSAGADDVVLKPFTAGAIVKRIKRLSSGRKPFVAANGYVGPVRAGMDAETTGETFVPPNALRPIEDLAEVAAMEAAHETAQRRLTAVRLADALREISAAARRTIAAGTPTQEDYVLLVGIDEHLTPVTRGMVFEDVLEALDRLASLSNLAFAAETGINERAAKLVAEITDMIVLIVGRGQSDVLSLPADIIGQIDKRFPEIAARKSSA